MKNKIWIPLLFLLAFLVSRCANNSQAASPVLTAEPLAVKDKASLIAALGASDATIETAESVSQVFFTPEGSIIKVNGADVQVLAYENSEEMENEAFQVSPDGGSIGTSMVTWMDVPHFYKTVRIVVNRLI